MVKALVSGLMAKNILGIIDMAKNMVMDSSIGLMVGYIKGNGSTANGLMEF
jgi:hypothetical protein